MSIETIKPGLFGLVHTNRDFGNRENWGKNQFNSSFPASLACYMAAKGLEPVYLSLNTNLEVSKTNITVQSLFGKEQFSELYFNFEAIYTPYSPMAIGSLPRVDLVTQDMTTSHKDCLSALEIKLTALPDNQTYNLPEEQYGCEIVVRPDTIVYLGLSIAAVYLEEKNLLLDILNPVCSTVEDWADPAIVHPILKPMVATLNSVLINKLDKQTPLLMQPIWKTKGKAGILTDNCFDLFVWSNFAFTRLFVDSAIQNLSYNVTRQERSVLWLIKMLYDFARQGQFNRRQIIDSLTYNTKNDKAFAAGGTITRRYMACDELLKPRIKKDAIKDIILGGGQNFLSPERRLDAAILNTPGLFI